MAKKKVQPADDNVEVIVPDVEENNTSTQEESTKASKKNKKTKNTVEQPVKDAKSDKNSKNDKNAKNNKNKKEKKSLKKRASEVISELKKVSKPSFGKVVKNTCVVIAVVAICTVLLLGVEKLFSLIYDLLLPNA